MATVATIRNDLYLVPLTGRFFGIALLLQIARLRRPIAINRCSTDGPEISAISFLDLALQRTRPYFVFLVHGKAIEDATVAFSFFTRRKTLLSPAKFERQMEVVILIDGTQ